MGKIYVITSGKGGTGKTTTAVNLGAALNKFKEDVTIVDTNLITPNIGLYLGAPIVPISLNDVLKGDLEIEEAVYEHESGTKILPCSLSIKNLNNIEEEAIEKIIEEIRGITNHAVLDSAAGLGKEARMAIRAADEAIIVANPNTLSVTDALKTIKTIEDLGKSIRGVIITRVKNTKTEMSLEDIRDMLEIPILGVVPEDKEVEKALVKKDAVMHTKPRAKSAKAYRDIAAKILGKKKKDSLFEKVLKKVGLR